MDLLFVPVVALALSIDCYAVAVGASVSMTNVSRRQILRTSLSFGLFQFAMPILGWLAGRGFADSIAAYDHWVAFALLFAIGARMGWKALCEKDGDAKAIDTTKGLALLTLSIATSIDALGVGLSAAFVEIKIITASVIIGAVAFLVTADRFSFCC